MACSGRLIHPGAEVEAGGRLTASLRLRRWIDRKLARGAKSSSKRTRIAQRRAQGARDAFEVGIGIARLPFLIVALACFVRIVCMARQIGGRIEARGRGIVLVVFVFRVDRAACGVTVASTDSAGRLGVAQKLLQAPHFGLVEFHIACPGQAFWQTDRTETDPRQPAHGQLHSVEQAPDLTVAPFAQCDPVPMVRAVSTNVLEGVETRQAIVEADPLEQSGTCCLVNPSEDAHRIFTLPAVAWMHKAIGDVARGSEDQQPFGIEVEPANGHPARALEARQTMEDRGPLVGIFAGGDLARGLMVEQHPRGKGLDLARQHPTVDADLIARADALPDVGRQSVDRDSSCENQFLHVAPRAYAGIGKNLLQLQPGGLRICGGARAKRRNDAGGLRADRKRIALAVDAMLSTQRPRAPVAGVLIPHATGGRSRSGLDRRIVCTGR